MPKEVKYTGTTTEMVLEAFEMAERIVEATTVGRR